MLNFRKLKQDYSPAILKEGRHLHEKKLVEAAKIIKLTPHLVRLSCRVQGSYDNTYTCELEIDRRESTTLDSDCDCPYKYDCQHLAAVLFYLENQFDSIIVAYAKESNIEKSEEIDEGTKANLLEAFKVAENKEVVRKGKKDQKDLLQEYVGSSQVLGQSPFFLPEEALMEDKAELAVLSAPILVPNSPYFNHIEIQLALRLPYRSKPLNIPNIKEFLEAVRYQEPLYIGSKRYFFGLKSFDETSAQILKLIMDYCRYYEAKDERGLRIAHMDPESFGTILAECYDIAVSKPIPMARGSDGEVEAPAMPCFYGTSLESPLRFSGVNAALRFEIEYLEAPAPKILLKPKLVLDQTRVVNVEEATLFECAKPGVINQGIYFRFQPSIKRKHLRHVPILRNVTIPEPLFGTFIENSLPQFAQFAENLKPRGDRAHRHTPFCGSARSGMRHQLPQRRAGSFSPLCLRQD